MSAVDTTLAPTPTVLPHIPNATTSQRANTVATVRRIRRDRAAARKAGAGKIPEYKIRSSISLMQQEYKVIKNKFTVSKLPVARGAYIGLRRARGEHLKRAEELMEEDDEYAYINWDAT